MNRIWELVILTNIEHFLEFIDKEIPYRLPEHLSEIELFKWENSELILNSLHLRKPKEYEPYSGEYDYMLSGNLELVSLEKGKKRVDYSFAVAPIEITQFSFNSLHIYFYKEFSYLPKEIPDASMKRFFIESDKSIFPLLQYIYDRSKDLFEVKREKIFGEKIKIPKNPKRLRIWEEIYKLLIQMEDEYRNQLLDGYTIIRHITWEERIQYLSDSMNQGLQIPTERTLREIMKAGRSGYLFK